MDPDNFRTDVPPPEKYTDLTADELVDCCMASGVLTKMGVEQVDEVVVAYLQRQPARYIVQDLGDPPMMPHTLSPIYITYRLETAIYGGEVYAAITAGHRVVVAPFLWKGYEELSTIKLEKHHR